VDRVVGERVGVSRVTARRYLEHHYAWISSL
jgi:response regulator of citrate/malate metabolism